jgi:hypothetical protein
MACTAATVLVFSGCQSPPRPPEIRDTVKSQRQQLEDMVNRMIQRCNGNQECETFWRNWLADRLLELQQLEIEALRENWRDAYERRKEWEKKIRDMLPNWPDIKPLLPWGKNAIVTADLTSSPLGVDQESEGSSWDTTVSVVGQISFSLPVLSASFDISGHLSLEGQTASNGSVTANIYAGALTAKNSTVDSITLTIEKDEGNIVTIDSTGNGTASFVVSRFISDKTWNAVTPYYIRINLPVVRTSNGEVRLLASNVRLADLMPFATYRLSDYNGDGILDHASDYAAILADYAAQVRRADVNCDGVYTPSDLDEWNSMFTEDTQP